MKHILNHRSLSAVIAWQPTPKNVKISLSKAAKDKGGGNEKADATNAKRGRWRSPQVSTFSLVQFVLCSASAMRKNLSVRKVGMKKKTVMMKDRSECEHSRRVQAARHFVLTARDKRETLHCLDAEKCPSHTLSVREVTANTQLIDYRTPEMGKTNFIV